MSYSSFGAYYATRPGIDFIEAVGGCGGCNGVGSLGCDGIGCGGCGGLGSCGGCGCGGCGGLGAANAIGFSASEVWNNVKKSNACYAPTGPLYKACGAPKNAASDPSKCGPCNYAGANAVRSVQAGLNQLGYGPFPVDGQALGAWNTAWKEFLATFNMTPGPGFGLSEAGLQKMEAELNKGTTPGPRPPQTCEKVGNEFSCVPKGETPGEKKSGMGTFGIIALIVVGGVAAGALLMGKKKPGSTSTAMTLSKR